MYGAAGGLGFDAIAGGIGSAGGNGATVSGTLSLSAGTTVIVDVGGRGGNAAYGSKIGGINGGGSSTSSGGGGGATDIKVGGIGLSNRVLVAAGGGGAGADAALYGPNGLENGTCSPGTGGVGGAADHDGDPGNNVDTGAMPDFILGGGGGGFSGNSTSQPGQGGAGGVPSSPVITDCLGNAGATATAGSAGANGSLGQGGSGGVGGGGGGGEIGGGGGAAGAFSTSTTARDFAADGGGAGGSSYGGGVSNYVLLNDTADIGANNELGGDGEAVITYTLGANTPPIAPAGQIAATSSTSPVLAVTGLSLAPLLMAGTTLVLSGTAMLRVSVRGRPRKKA